MRITLPPRLKGFPKLDKKQIVEVMGKDTDGAFRFINRKDGKDPKDFIWVNFNAR